MGQDLSRVVWYEGMTLDPHHLQQWDRFQQSRLHARVRAVARYDWGLTRLEIDRERLVNGELRLLVCSGVMPDGLAFDIPDHDPAPASRNVQEFFPATQEQLKVFLAVPSERRNGSNFTLQGATSRRETRYQAATISVLDENTGTDERQVEVAHPNFQLRFGGESLEAYTVLQLAEIVRDPSGVFALNEQYIPSCLSLTASKHLQAIARRLLELLVTKSTSLSERAQRIFAQRELSPSDATVLGLLSAVNAYIPLMNHHYATGGGHPEALYTTMLALAGQLSVYAANARIQPADYPLYDYAALTGCFNRLDEVVREMLYVSEPGVNYFPIPLQRQRENRYTAQVDAHLLEQAQLFVVARGAGIPEDKLVAGLPQMLRVASPQNIDDVLYAAVRALELEHTTRLPAGMPVDQQANYFQLQKRGPSWDAIRDAGAIAIFVPAEFNRVNLELVAVNRPG